MKHPIYENFIVNKDEANINEIQNKLQFSSNFGKETFFTIEQFYKKGDEDRLQKDYSQQNTGKTFFLKNKDKLDRLRMYISSIKDIRGLYKRAFVNLEESDLFDLKQFILTFNDITTLFQTTEITITAQYPDLHPLLLTIDPLYPTAKNFFIYPNYTSELKQFVDESDGIKQQFDKECKKIEQKLINTYKENIEFDKFTILLKESPLTNDLEFLSNVDIIEDTLYFIKIRPKKNNKIITLEHKIQKINEAIENEKRIILKAISDKIFQNKQMILDAFSFIGYLDSFLTKIVYAIRYNCIVPEITFDRLCLEDAENLILKEILNKEGLDYSPLSIDIHIGLSILTGSNMGGKTCVLKTMAQIVYLVHAGLMVPAKKASIPLFNKIYISKLIQSSIREGLSNFGYELFTLKPLFEDKDKFLLFLLDEPASGTNPIEGKAIVKTLADTLAKSHSLSIISTHYDGIAKDLPCKKYVIRGINAKNLSSIMSAIKDDNEFSIKSIHPFIDHSLIEVNSNEEVPKNAIDLLYLFKFNNEFIQSCRRNIMDKKS